MSLDRESPFCHKVVYSVEDASTEIDPQQAILEYSRGKWPTISSPFNSVTANLLIDYQTLFEELMSENKCIFALRKC